MAASVESLRALFPSSTEVKKNKPAPTYHFFMEKVQWFQTKPARYTKDHYIQVLENKSFSLARLAGISAWKTTLTKHCSDDLSLYKSALGEMITKVLFTYCPKLEGILEIGSGFFPLTDYIPNIYDDLKSKIALSDLREAAVKRLKQTQPHNPVFELDITQLTETIQKGTYQSIIMRDVLSVLHIEDLAKSIKEISSVLKPGGLMIHMLHREPFFSALFEYSARNNHIIFPGEMTEHQITSFFFVNKNDIETVMESLPEKDQTKIAVSYYLHLFTSEKEEFCSLLQQYGIEALKYLADCVVKLKCPTAKKMSLTEIFVTISETHLKNEGFEIVKSEFIQSSVIVERGEAHKESSDMQQFSINIGVR